VIFNEVIPNPTDEYYRELQRLKIVTAGPPRDPATYQYLDHLDDEDGLTYKVTRVEQLKGYIVAYRRLVTPRASDTREELVPVHIADICCMTDDLVQARKASAATPNQDSRPTSNGTPETPSQRTSTVMELDENTGPISRARVNTSGVLQSSLGEPPPFRSRKGLRENLSTGNRRVNFDRSCKHTNMVYTLPEDIAPSSYRAAINSDEAVEWRKAIKAELSRDSYRTHLGVHPSCAATSFLRRRSISDRLSASRLASLSMVADKRRKGLISPRPSHPW
jgi:hypothetical protein